MTKNKEKEVIVKPSFDDFLREVNKAELISFIRNYEATVSKSEKLISVEEYFNTLA